MKRGKMSERSSQVSGQYEGGAKEGRVATAASQAELRRKDSPPGKRGTVRGIKKKDFLVIRRFPQFLKGGRRKLERPPGVNHSINNLTCEEQNLYSEKFKERRHRLSGGILRGLDWARS